MPILLFRHGQTDKNVTGGIDSYLTPLNEEGVRQAQQAGRMLEAYCRDTGIKAIQPVISAFPQANGTLIPFLRTYQTAAWLLEPVQQNLPAIELLPVIADPRSRDVKFKRRGTESGCERLFSDQREVDGETLAGIEQRIAGYYDDYLAAEPAMGILHLSICHTTVGRFLIARHFGHSLDYVEGHIPALHNLQGLAFTPSQVETVFEGFAIDKASRLIVDGQNKNDFA